MVNHYRFGIFVLFNYSLYKLTYSTVFSFCVKFSSGIYVIDLIQVELFL